MGLDVTMLESDADLASRARALLGKSAQVVEGELEGGVKKHAPFDFILIDGAVEEIPQASVRQLRDGGKLATVHLDAMGVGREAVGVRSGDTFGLPELADATAAERLPGFARDRASHYVTMHTMHHKHKTVSG